jgi:hypothetical protein
MRLCGGRGGELGDTVISLTLLLLQVMHDTFGEVVLPDVLAIAPDKILGHSTPVYLSLRRQTTATFNIGLATVTYGR